MSSNGRTLVSGTSNWGSSPCIRTAKGENEKANCLAFVRTRKSERCVSLYKVQGERRETGSREFPVREITCGRVPAFEQRVSTFKQLTFFENAGTGRGRETKVSRGGNTKTEGFWGELKTRRPCIRTA